LAPSLGAGDLGAVRTWVAGCALALVIGFSLIVAGQRLDACTSDRRSRNATQSVALAVQHLQFTSLSTMPSIFAYLVMVNWFEARATRVLRFDCALVWIGLSMFFLRPHAPDREFEDSRLGMPALGLAGLLANLIALGALVTMSTCFVCRLLFTETTFDICAQSQRSCCFWSAVGSRWRLNRS
jgi:hypothetical protein